MRKVQYYQLHKQSLIHLIFYSLLRILSFITLNLTKKLIQLIQCVLLCYINGLTQLHQIYIIYFFTTLQSFTKRFSGSHLVAVIYLEQKIYQTIKIIIKYYLIIHTSTFSRHFIKKTYQQQIMFSSFGFFCKEFERYLKISQPLDVRLYPSKLILQLKKKSAKDQFIQALTKKSKNGFKIMRKLTVVHLIMMNNDQFCDLMEKFVQNPMESSDPWLNEKCIRPYYHFIKKALVSQELYIKTKELSYKNLNFQLVFYLINLFTELFKIVDKMPLLGRYYKNSNEFVTASFIEGIAVQSQKLYNSLKNGILQILTNHTAHIKNIEDEKLLKVVLEQSLVIINEEMKKLFLDKYFYPLGRGICIRLFRIEQQNEQTIKIIKGIISNHQETERCKAYTQLENALFPEDGKVNMQFYEQTLRGPQGKKEQYAIFQEEHGQQFIKINFEESQIKQNQQKYLRETSHLSNPDNEQEMA